MRERSIINPVEHILIHSSARSITKRHVARGELAGFKELHSAGISFSRGDMIRTTLADPVPGDSSLGHAAMHAGEWLSVFSREGVSKERSGTEYLVAADAYGYCPAFYAIAPGQGVVVSDSFSGVVQGLTGLGVVPAFDAASYLAALVGNATQFLNLFSSQTMAHEVQILRPTEFLWVSSTDVLIGPRDQLGRTTEPLDYDAEVEAGIALAHDQLRRVAGLDGVQRVINLSGGVDSRLVLALLTSAGVHERFQIRTMDPRTWQGALGRDVIERDVVIANVLRSELGMEWARRGNRIAVPTTFRESLEIHQSFRSNYGFTFNPGESQTIHEMPVLSLRGGGGEILRHTDSGRLLASLYGARAAETPNRSISASSWLAERFLMGSVVIDELRSAVMQTISEAFREADGESFEERFNDYYFLTRNRAHFGHARHSSARNDIPLQMLSNAHFLRASRMLSFEERANGRLVRDIFARTDPSLLKYPFENSDATAELCTGDTVSVDLDSKDWQATLGIASDSGETRQVQPLGWHHQERHPRFSKTQSSMHFLHHAVPVLESYLPESTLPVVRRQHRALLKRLSADRRRLFPTVAKLASAVEVFLPMANNGAAITLRCEAHVPPPQVSLGSIRISPLVFPMDGWRERLDFVMQPTLARVGDELVVAANPRNADADLLYAFYLYRDDQKVGEKWYGRGDVARFPLAHSTGTYMAKAFARHGRAVVPTYSWDSATLVIGDEI